MLTESAATSLKSLRPSGVRIGQDTNQHSLNPCMLFGLHTDVEKDDTFVNITASFGISDTVHYVYM